MMSRARGRCMRGLRKHVSSRRSHAEHGWVDGVRVRSRCVSDPNVGYLSSSVYLAALGMQLFKQICVSNCARDEVI